MKNRYTIVCSVLFVKKAKSQNPVMQIPELNPIYRWIAPSAVCSRQNGMRSDLSAEPCVGVDAPFVVCALHASDSNPHFPLKLMNHIVAYVAYVTKLKSPDEDK